MFHKTLNSTTKHSLLGV